MLANTKQVKKAPFKCAECGRSKNSKGKWLFNASHGRCINCTTKARNKAKKLEPQKAEALQAPAEQAEKSVADIESEMRADGAISDPCQAATPPQTIAQPEQAPEPAPDLFAEKVEQKEGFFARMFGRRERPIDDEEEEVDADD